MIIEARGPVGAHAEKLLTVAWFVMMMSVVVPASECSRPPKSLC